MNALINEKVKFIRKVDRFPDYHNFPFVVNKGETGVISHVDLASEIIQVIIDNKKDCEVFWQGEKQILEFQKDVILISNESEKPIRLLDFYFSPYQYKIKRYIGNVLIHTVKINNEKHEYTECIDKGEKPDIIDDNLKYIGTATWDDVEVNGVRQ